MELATVDTEPRRSHVRPPARRVALPDAVAAGLVALHVVAVTWLVAGGGLYIDDIRAQAYAAGRTWWPFVVESNETHLAPGARTVDWIMATFAPLEHWPAVLATMAIALLMGLASTRLAVRVISHPWARVLAVGWVLFAASVIPTYAWFRQALTGMLPLALVLLIASLLVDHARSARWQPWALAVGLHAVALTFSERALAVPILALALLVVAASPAQRREPRWWRRTALTVAPFAVANVLFLLAYTTGDFDRAERARPGLVDAAVKIGRWVLVDLLPSFIGGPVFWRGGAGAYSFAATPAVLVGVASTLTVIGLVIATRTTGSVRAAAPVAVVAGAYALPVLAMIYVGRLARVEDVAAADDLRLLPDVSAAVAIALAALVGSVLEHRNAGHPARSGRWRRLAMATCAATVAVLSTLTWVGFGLRWHNTPVTDYLATMRNEVTATTRQVLPTTVPPEIIPGWVDPAFTTGPLIRLLNPEVLQGTLSGSAAVVGASGALATPAFGRVARASVPEGFCGLVIPVGERSVTLPLDQAAPYFRGSMMQLGILVGDAERLNISVTGRDGRTWGPLVEDPPELLRGPHRIHALVPYGVAVESITLTVETANTAGVCVTSADVSTIGPAS